MTLSRLAEFRAAEKALQEQLAQLEALKNDAGLKKEIEFEEKLQALMKTYGKSLRDIITILDPNPSASKGASAPKQRKARVLKVYQNPHTGELIEPEAGKTSDHRLALGVKDLGLGHDLDDNASHGCSSDQAG